MKKPDPKAKKTKGAALFPESQAKKAPVKARRSRKLTPLPPYRTGLVRASLAQLRSWCKERKLPFDDADSKSILVGKLDHLIGKPES